MTVSYIKKLVEKQAKTHREVTEILRQRYPGVEGLSAREAFGDIVLLITYVS